MTALFGISITSAEQFRSLPPCGFSALEIPGEIVESAAGKIPQTMPCIVRDLCDPRILAELPGCSFGIRMDFYRMIEARALAAERIHAGKITLSLPLERLLNDASYAAKMKELLLGCWGTLERFRLTAALEARLPGNSPEQLTAWQKFQRDLLYPVQILWALHPHEPGGAEAAENLPVNFRFDRDLWRFEFDAASGNYLSGKLLTRLSRNVLSSGADPALILLAPGKGAAQEDFQLLAQNIGEMESVS